MPSRPKGVLFDLDGVLYNADTPIPGTDAAVARVRRLGIPHLFLTNTTSRPRSALVAKLASFGIQSDESQIWTPPAATVEWLARQPAGPAALFVPEATRAELAAIPQVHPNSESGADYVVIGDLGSQWDFATLNRAFRLLHANPRGKLIALGMTRYWKSHDGVSLDVAPFVAALQHATGREPIVLGKPGCEFFLAAASKLNLPPDQILMIGDDIRADVGGAQAVGMSGALVRTGKFREDDLGEEITPDAVLDSVADLADDGLAALGIVGN